MLSITSNCHVGLRARKLSRTQRVPYKLSIRKATEYCPEKSVLSPTFNAAKRRNGLSILE